MVYFIFGYGMIGLIIGLLGWNWLNNIVYVVNDVIGNLMYVVYVLFVVVMIFGGSL